MDATDEQHDLADDDEVTAHRDRAKRMLNQIAQQAKRALHEAGIDLDLFFMIPYSGDAIITFGTAGDPDVVRQTVGLDHTRCREVTCATTDDSIADHQPQASSVQLTEPPRSRPAPTSTPALQQAGADSCDITSGDRFRLPASHPFLAEVIIDPVNWYDLQRLDDDNPATCIIGHDAPQNGKMAVFIACASDEVRRRVEDGWGCLA